MTARHIPETLTSELTGTGKNPILHQDTELKSEFPYIIQPVWKQAVEEEALS